MTDDATPPLLPEDPVHIAHFRILGRLGAGGMGIVYRAEDEKLRRIVALKLLPDPGRSEERRHRFVREARSAAAISHPNVAVVHAIDEADGRVYIATELVEGESLRARMERGPLDFAAARDIALQIAKGLAAAHDKGIVHRDLKPENVMITSSGVVKLLDFGLAKGAAAQPVSSKSGAELARTETLVTSDEGRVMGTPSYMSPEQGLGETLDVRSDVFSLGIVMYEMFAGARPFEGASTGAVLVAIARDPPAPLRERAPHVDEWTADVVMRCLAKERQQRFASAGEIVAALTGATSPKATTQSHVPLAPVTRPAPMTAVTAASSPRRRTGTMLAGAVLAALVQMMATYAQAVHGSTAELLVRDTTSLTLEPLTTGDLLVSRGLFGDAAEMGAVLVVGPRGERELVSGERATVRCGGRDPARCVLWRQEQGTSALAHLDATSGKLDPPFFRDPAISDVAVSPDGATVVVTTNTDLLTTVRVADGETHRFSTTPAAPGWGTWRTPPTAAASSSQLRTWETRRTR